MPLSPKRVAVGIAVLVALALAGRALDARWNDHLVAAQTRLQLAQRSADSASRAALGVLRADSVLRARAGADSALAAEATHRADSLAAAGAAVRARYHSAVVDAPDTCRRVIALADSSLAAADGTVTQLRGALQASQSRAHSLATALDSTSDALTHLRASTGLLGAAAHDLARASRRSLLQRVTPRLGAGLAVGVDGQGRPHLITGITLGWTF